MALTGEIDRWLALALSSPPGSTLGSAHSDCAIQRPFPDSASDGDTFIDRVRFHSVAGLLADRSAAMEALAHRVHEAVRGEAQRQAILEASRAPVLKRTVSAFAAAGLDHVLLKGTVLAYSLYDKPSDRVRGDIDLLIREDQRAKASAVLRDLGFTHTASPNDGLHQQPWLSAPEFGIQHELDLHWRMSNSPALESLFPQDVFARAVPLVGLSDHARGMDRVCLLIHCALNQIWHENDGFVADGKAIKGARRLGWTYDIHLLAQSLRQEEWAELVAMATASGAAPIVQNVLHEAQQQFSSPLPPEPMKALNSAPTHNWLTRYLEDMDFVSRLRQDLRATDSISRKCGLLRWHALPPEARLRKRFPGKDGWPVLALHILRFASGPLRWMFGKAPQ